MAYQAVGIGSSANDGTGDTLRVGIDKVNDNFVELYTALGAGSTTALKVVTTGASAGQALVYDSGNARFQPGSVAISATISSLTFEGGTADSFETTLNVVDPTADRTINFPNDSGTVLLQAGTSTAAASDEASSAGAVTSNADRITHTLTIDGTTADNAEIADVTVTNSKVTASSVILATSRGAVDIIVHTVASGSFKYIIVNKSGGTLANDSTVITNFIVI